MNTSMTELNAALANTATGRRDFTIRNPEPRERKYLLISVDDHLCEPPWAFEGRMPQKFADRAPHVVREDGVDYWMFEDVRIGLQASNGLASWDPSQWDTCDVTYDDFGSGIYEIHDRIRDMDIGAVYGSLCFPSMVFGFAGQRFMKMRDTDLGLASMRAYNDWICEEWVGSYPSRMIGCQVAWLLDPEIAAAEIRRNAERGFKAVAFTENPEKLGLPSLHTDHWHPFLRACEETETVINLHIGSSSHIVVPSTDSPVEVTGTLIPFINGFSACMDWMYSRVPVLMPDIKFVISEGGIGWLPLLIDRLRHQERVFVEGGIHTDRGPNAPSPQEILQRNFWFTTYYDPLALEHREAIGLDRIMLECDYPHADSSWPDTQDLIHEMIGDFPAHDQNRLSHLNAADLYRHPVPEDAQAWLRAPIGGASAS